LRLPGRCAWGGKRGSGLLGTERKAQGREGEYAEG
jgi:hypothetical protein